MSPCALPVKGDKRPKSQSFHGLTKHAAASAELSQGLPQTLLTKANFYVVSDLRRSVPVTES